MEMKGRQINFTGFDLMTCKHARNVSSRRPFSINYTPYYKA